MEAADLFKEVHEGYSRLMRSQPQQRGDFEDEEDKFCSDEELWKKFKIRAEDALVQHRNSLKRLALRSTSTCTVIDNLSSVFNVIRPEKTKMLNKLY